MHCKNGDTLADYDVITAYAPSSTSFAVGDLVTLKIIVWRSDPIGTTDFTYQWHDTSDAVPTTLTSGIIVKVTGGTS